MLLIGGALGRTIGAGRPDAEVAQGETFWRAMHGKQRVFEFEERTARHGELVLVGLIHGTDGVIEEWRCGFLDVVAEDICYRFALGEFDEPLDARLEGREVLDVEATGIHSVS